MEGARVAIQDGECKVLILLRGLEPRHNEQRLSAISPGHEDDFLSRSIRHYCH
jgi:hypothetical protein